MIGFPCGRSRLRKKTIDRSGKAECKELISKSGESGKRRQENENKGAILKNTQTCFWINEKALESLLHLV